MKEYKRRLEEIREQMQTASGMEYILLEEEKEELEWLTIETA